MKAGKGWKIVRAIDEHLDGLHVRRRGCLALCHLPASPIEQALALGDGENEGRRVCGMAIY